MYKFSDLTFDDFEFKGEKLSEHDGYVGSASGGLKTYSLLPQRSYTTDKPINSDITTVYASSLQPRQFEVPVVFDELTDGKLREIAQWLDSPTPQKFKWVGDNTYINCCLDSSDFNVSSSSGIDGQIPLKFIAHDPFYYNVEQTTQTIATPTSGTIYNYINNGYGELPPKLTIGCTGTIKIEILDKDNNVLTTTNIDSIIGGVTINSYSLECTLLSGANHFAHIDSFPYLPSGTFGIRITGSHLGSMSLEYRERYL